MEFITKIKRSFYDNSERELCINPEFLKFEDKDHKENLYTFLKSEDIIAYRYGIKWIKGLKFIIGREYQIFIKSRENKILKINFKSFYGKNKEANHQNFNEILTALWQNYFGSIASSLIQKHRNNEPFSIEKINFDKEGITIQNNSLLNTKNILIPWSEVRTKDYYNYFAIYSIKDSSSINQCYYYKDDWNTTIIYSVLKTILEEKNIES